MTDNVSTFIKQEQGEYEKGLSSEGVNMGPQWEYLPALPIDFASQSEKRFTAYCDYRLILSNRLNMPRTKLYVASLYYKHLAMAVPVALLASKPHLVQ